ncbi:hypothetical protein KAFR_0A05000 [Kazachstania africana CBS 2517]|uniref:Condensin complex subunit 1 n=1 Tax=Kazachstania africana (strain ATCC 22294 / BCRC 22015 / CBS 2517 / CECT 1963 / NBRC 1671 / NRRL Y-8276) TaxID=1071382 RepID=H2ANI6_KAZAF|nr:hypothetical protein KAFR_0A05000 [Kazachstania africana CBS 2517]CCF55936.1 hypothetical protein KAFR_0A05000 [Kazachstania africana CBS 2517]
MSTFSLSEHLTRFQTADKKTFPPVERASNELNKIIDRLAVSPEQIDSDSDTLETLIDLCLSFPHLATKLQTQLTYLISSSLNNLTSEINGNLSTNINYNDLVLLLPQWRQHLEEYGFLIHVLLFFLQEDIHTASLRSSNLNRNRKNLNSAPSSNNENVETFKRCCGQVESLCDIIIKVLELNLSKIFQTTPEKDLFIGLFLRPLYSLTEVEPIVKVSYLKVLIQRIFCMSVKSHGQNSSIQNAIMTNLTYFLHLPNFNAELLTMLSNDYNYPQLTEDILKEISNRVFSAKDSTGPKSISSFLIKLSELSPVIMLRQMSLLIRLLNNSSITLRCSIVEACGNIVAQLAQDSQTFDHYKQQISVLIELLEERFQDSNPYVRTKAIQGCLKIVDLNLRINEKRSNFTKLSVRSLLDRSSLVRRNAIKLLSRLILKHPFSGIHGTQLKLADWTSNLQLAEEKSTEFSEDNNSQMEEEENDASELEREREAAAMESSHSEAIMKLKLMVAYYKDAISFIEDIHESIQRISNLLFSKNRNEVLEAMDFLVLTDAYDLEPSEQAIRKMLHLVWVKGTTDEGTSIATHLIDCYHQLFFTVPETFNTKERATHIAKNLIKLTTNASIADLASLEKLLGMMYEKSLIDENVVNVLWAIYNSCSNKKGDSPGFKKEQIHGSIIALGMLALENNEIILKGLDSLLNIGLGEMGDKDMLLCKYSCIALERMVDKKEISIKSAISTEHEGEAVRKLSSKIISHIKDPEFYPMCEQAISALFTISPQPDIVSSEIIREKTMMTFGKPEDADETVFSKNFSRVTSLSQLLFIVGQVAIKTLVYLEKCEAEFKKRKIEAEIRKGKEKDGQQPNKDLSTADESKDNELAMIGGTNEDDFTDAIQFVKENELLYGDNSILSKFCPLVEEIVSNSDRFNDTILQRTAVLCLEKLMLISSSYCEKSLPLLITVMEKSPDPIIRSNAVLGLGDMAVCFNNLLDENTDYLYRRLHDENLMVQRTCLMTVTFLILAGQVKVKGQLSEMAKCLENPDQGIGDMCRLFFAELATKDNAIYNGFIDIFSNLSSDEMLSKDGFKRIIKFLVAFIDKERHQKQLSEKLLNRLPKCDSQKQWDDIAFVLNCLPYKNDKLGAILEEGYKVVSARD